MPIEFDENLTYKFQEIKDSDWTNTKYLNEIIKAFQERILALNPETLPNFRSVFSPVLILHSNWYGDVYANTTGDIFSVDYQPTLIDDFEETFRLKGGDDISHFKFVSYMQEKIEEIATTEYEEYWYNFIQHEMWTTGVTSWVRYLDHSTLETMPESFDAVEDIPIFTIESFRTVAELPENGFRRCTEYPADTTDPNDPAWQYGFMEVGDIFGPWLWEDLKKALSALKITMQKRTADVVTVYEKTYNGSNVQSMSECWSLLDSVDCNIFNTYSTYWLKPDKKTSVTYNPNETKYSVHAEIIQHPIDYNFILDRPKTISTYAMTKEQAVSGLTGTFHVQDTTAIENKLSLMNTVSNVTSNLTIVFPYVENPCEELVNLVQANSNDTEKGWNLDKDDSYLYLINQWTFSNSNDGEDIPIEPIEE